MKNNVFIDFTWVYTAIRAGQSPVNVGW